MDAEIRRRRRKRIAEGWSTDENPLLPARQLYVSVTHIYCCSLAAETYPPGGCALCHRRGYPSGPCPMFFVRVGYRPGLWDAPLEPTTPAQNGRYALKARDEPNFVWPFEQWFLQVVLRLSGGFVQEMALEAQQIFGGWVVDPSGAVELAHPAGHYRITGVEPGTTITLYDGPAGGVVFGSGAPVPSDQDVVYEGSGSISTKTSPWVKIPTSPYVPPDKREDLAGPPLSDPSGNAKDPPS